MLLRVQRVDNLAAGVIGAVVGFVGVVYVIRDWRNNGSKVSVCLMLGALFSLGYGAYGLMTAF